MKKINILIYFCLCILLFSCFGNNLESDNNNISDYTVKAGENNDKEIILPAPYKKLENFIGKDFIPVFAKEMNLDNDINEEIIIVYKRNESENISITFFDQYSNGVLKKKFDFQSSIFEKDSFSFSMQNLFSQDDISFVLEGKSIDEKWYLYIFSYVEENYEQLGNFSADYSIMLDFKETDYEDYRTGKYLLLKDITTIKNTLSATNSSIKEKSVYRWDSDTNEFILIENSQILSTNVSIDRSIASNPEKFLKYLSGFWYPYKYKELIDSDKLEPDKFTSGNIEFINFNNEENEICLKNEDYMNRYIIEKKTILWGKYPGLKIKVNDYSRTSKYRSRYIEISLVNSDTLKVTGPYRVNENFYYRFPRPFIEYVTEKKQSIVNEEMQKISDFLNDEYIIKEKKPAKEPVIFNFLDDNKFSIIKGEKEESGHFKIIKEDIGYIISFMYDTDRSIFSNEDFIIKVYTDEQLVALLPVSVRYDGYIIDDLKEILLEKRNKG